MTEKKATTDPNRDSQISITYQDSETRVVDPLGNLSVDLMQRGHESTLELKNQRMQYGSIDHSS